MTGQAALVFCPVDERRLGDVERTVLEAIDVAGYVTVLQAGRISYRLRGWTCLVAVPRRWQASAGLRALGKLESLGVVQRGACGRWRRAAAGSPDLIAPATSVAGAYVARCGNRDRGSFGNTLQKTAPNRRFFASAPATRRTLSVGQKRRIGKARGGVGRHCAVAGHEPARLRERAPRRRRVGGA